MSTQDEDRDVVQRHCFDPFPEPQTIPAGWDISAILSAPQPASDQQTVDSSETESN